MGSDYAIVGKTNCRVALELKTGKLSTLYLVVSTNWGGPMGTNKGTLTLGKTPKTYVLVHSPSVLVHSPSFHFMLHVLCLSNLHDWALSFLGSPLAHLGLVCGKPMHGDGASHSFGVLA